MKLFPILAMIYLVLDDTLVISPICSLYTPAQLLYKTDTRHCGEYAKFPTKASRAAKRMEQSEIRC